MNQLMVLEVELVQRIADIGRREAPNEACGLLLPTPIRGVQVIELPNRSDEPEDSVEVHGIDMLAALDMIFGDSFTEDMVPGLTVWHTHPGGNVGPSEFDLANRSPVMRNLVVTLTDIGPPLATWF